MDPLSRLLNTVLAGLDSRFSRVSHGRFRDAPLAMFMLLPCLVILGVFGVAPLFYSVFVSLFDLRSGVGPFCGLSNYVRALTGADFWDSLLITVYFAAGSIPVSLAISFLIANGLFRIARGRGLFRTVYFLPYITSVVAAATVWRVMLEPRFGVVNACIGTLGFSENPFSQWLLEPRSILHLLTSGWISEGVGPSLALCCVILFEIWHVSGFMIVIFLAGLTALPRELEESARIDGATWLQVTRRITIPLLSPTILFLLIISVIKAFQAFNSFYALTGNGQGPVNTTQNMTVYIFASFYLNGREGYGAAVATLLAVSIVALTIVQWRIVGRKVYYD